jgi:6-phosphofructokinase 1
VATEAIDRLRDTAESHDRVMLVEVMGRDAGFIALHAGIAGGAHAILVPEIPYRLEPIAEMVRKRRQAGKPFSIIVVSEGARPRGGEVSVAGPREVGAMRKLFGAAAKVAVGLGELIELDCRATVLGHIQRGGSPSNFDRVLGMRFGEAAANLVARGEFGRMVALEGTEIVSVPIDEALGVEKRVDPNGRRVGTARAMGVVFGDE